MFDVYVCMSVSTWDAYNIILFFIKMGLHYRCFNLLFSSNCPYLSIYLPNIYLSINHLFIIDQLIIYQTTYVNDHLSQLPFPYRLLQCGGMRNCREGNLGMSVLQATLRNVHQKCYQQVART